MLCKKKKKIKVTLFFLIQYFVSSYGKLHIDPKSSPLHVIHALSHSTPQCVPLYGKSAVSCPLTLRFPGGLARTMGCWQTCYKHRIEASLHTGLGPLFLSYHHEKNMPRVVPLATGRGWESGEIEPSLAKHFFPLGSDQLTQH